MISTTGVLSRRFSGWIAGTALITALSLGGCGHAPSADAGAMPVSVGVVQAARKSLERSLTVSSELVPFQETDVYAKESGYVHSLLVDYGSRVRAGQLMAVLEIPELEAQLRQDDAMTRNAKDRVAHAENERNRVEAQHHALHLQADRLSGVARSQPGLVAQQEVDDAVGRDLAAEAAVEAAKSNLEAMRSDLLSAEAKREHDRVLMDYSRITAPFTGVVSQRYANLGMLMQAGTSSSTQAMPLVRLSQNDLFRLVIPVPESYVRFVKAGDPVEIKIPALNRTLTGRIARFSVDVKSDTRTMHTEVDIPNSDGKLVPGMYGEAVLRLERKEGALAVPLIALNREGEQATLYVVNAQSKIESRRVTLGIQTDTDAEVLSGLNEGDTIVASDRGGLRAGQSVLPRPMNSGNENAAKDNER
jgi:RND family efflux transporter MFP subunit